MHFFLLHQYKSHMVRGDIVDLTGDNEVVEVTSPNNRSTALFLRLSSEFDPNGALSPQRDLQDSLRKNFCAARVEEVVFRSTGDILRALRRCPDHSVSHLSILTHGTFYSITVGYEQLHMLGADCTSLVLLLREKLLPRASILLCACNTGKVIPLASNRTRRERLTHGIDNDLPFTTLSFVDWCYPNFANLLSMRLPGHAVFCTPNQQVRNELVLRYKYACKATGPVPVTYLSRRQTMFRYFNRDTACHFEAPEVQGLEGGGDYSRTVKRMVREYEARTRRRCNDVRRSINAYIKMKNSM